MKRLLRVLQRKKKKEKTAEPHTQTPRTLVSRNEGPGYASNPPILSADPPTKAPSESGSGRQDSAESSTRNGAEKPQDQLTSFLSEGGAYQNLQRLFALEQSARGVYPQALTLLNRVQPIGCLPPEVLTIVFRLAIGPAATPNLRGVVHLSSVCRNWRTIILGDGVMWSSTCVPGRHPTFIAQLERSRGAPLHLFVNIPPTTSRVEGFTSSILRASQAIDAKRGQVRSISATIRDFRVFRGLFGSDWPNLEELGWIDACPTRSRIHEEGPPIPEAHQTPKLRCLSAQQGIAWWITSTTSLTTLKLEGPMDIDVLGFLRANSRLESIEFVNLDLQPSPGNTTSFDLPDVTSVVMRNVGYVQLFLYVAFPSLRRLVIDTLGHLGPVRAIAWSQLQAPLTLTTLEVTGSDGVGTNSLSMIESTAFWRNTPIIQAPSNTLLSSVTSLSIGRGTLGLENLAPSTAICTLVSGLPHLQYLCVLLHNYALTIADHLCSHPLDCPELKILSLAFADSICSMMSLLSGFLSARADSGRWVHRVDCVILEVPGEALGEAKRVWEFLSRYCGFAEYLRCDCVEDACGRKPRLDMHWPTRMAGFQRHSYLYHQP